MACNCAINAGSTPQTGFSEISRFAGVAATDWSWGALITDLDNNGYKRHFCGQWYQPGILTDQDYIQYICNGEYL